MAALAASCTPGLPSTTPLGRGPLAQSTVEEPAPPPAAPSAKSSAGNGKPDASLAPDAGAASTPEGGAKAPEGGGSADAGAQEAGAPGKQAVVYAGHYVGEDTTTFSLPNLPQRTEKDPNAKLDVADQGGGSLEFSLIDSKSGKVICKLQGTATGNTVKLGSGQHCFDKDSKGAMTATVDSGSATFKSAQIVFDLHLDLEINAAGQQMNGDLDYHFEGTRK